MTIPEGNVAAAAASISEAINNRPTEHTRRKSDNVEYTVDDFERAVAILKEIKGAKEATHELPDAETIEAVTELENNRLSNWLIKLTVYVFLFLFGLVITVIGYCTITKTELDLPPEILDSIITFKEILLAILNLKG